jgi:nucleotide-binding universal stress UspA family protein
VYRRILVPLDGSRFGENALPHALDLASRWNAAVELATVAAPQGAAGSARAPGVVGDESRARGEAAAGKYLGEVEGRIRGAGFQGEVNRTVIPAGNIAHSLVRHLGEANADFVVMTSHGRGALQRAWLGSTADAVIRRSPAPVLLVRPGEDEEAVPEPLDLSLRPPPFRRALLPLDGSEPAELLLGITPALMDPEGAAFLLLRAVPPFLAGGTPYLPHVVREAHEQKRVEEGAREYLERVAAPLREAGADVKLRVETSGQPATAILRAADEEEPDLIGMSTHGRGGVARLLLGSVADKVVRGAKVPVLLYRAPEEG